MKKPTQRSRAQAGKPTAFLTPAENPIRNGTFGDIGAFFTIKLQKPNANVRVEIPYSRGKVRNVSERSLRLFQWNQETHSLWLVGSSGVDLERRRVWAVIAEPGLYGVIGLPSDSGVLRTVAAFAMFSPEELRGSARLVSAICGLILCAAPGDGPPGGGPLCERCLGIEVPEAHFPEIQLLNPDRFGIFWRPSRLRQPDVWFAFRHDYRNTGQSSQNGPAAQPSVVWRHNPHPGLIGPDGHLSAPVVGADGTVYVVSNMYAHPFAPADLLALDGNSGQVKWSTRIAFPGSRTSWNPKPALDRRGNVVVNGADNGGVVAVNSAGVIEWRHNRPGRRLGNPVLSPDGQIYVVSRGEGIIALNANGQEVWAAPFANGDIDNGGLPDDTLVAVRDDGTVIVIGDNVWALSPNGQVLWTHALTNPGLHSLPVVADDGRILISGRIPVSPSHETRVLSPSGVLQALWAFSSASLSVERGGGVTYLSDGGPSVHALNSAGVVLWHRLLGHFMFGNGSVAIGNDGIVYHTRSAYPMRGLEIRALDPATGNDVWVTVVPDGGDTGLNNPVIGLGGTLLVPDSFGNLWALR